MNAARFHDEARAELIEQAIHYEAASSGLGQRFNAEIEAAVNRAASFPEQGAPYRYGTRRVFPKSFPFSVIYLHLNGEIVVMAIAHFRRRPGYWRNRKRDR